MGIGRLLFKDVLAITEDKPHYNTLSTLISKFRRERICIHEATKYPPIIILCVQRGIQKTIINGGH